MPWQLAGIFMKWNILVLGSCALALASCETGQISTQGDFDPLVPPGSGRTAVAARSGYKPGSFVRTNMDNVAFFSKRPKGDSEAEKTLAGNTEMKVIADDGNYVKAELNSGEVGYVPSVQVTDQKSGLAPVGSVNEFQVYPPAPGSVPPVVDPNIPSTPSVIDPDAPVVVPEAPPIPGDNLPPVEPAPLPPGNESKEN
jgi:hypothetical protein